MIGVLATGLIVASLGFAVWALAAGLLKRVPGTLLLGGVALLELAAIAQLVGAIVQLVRGERPAELATFFGYVVGSILLFPVAVVWAAIERSRWSSVVLGVAGLVFAILVVRMQQVWTGA